RALPFTFFSLCFIGQIDCVLVRRQGPKCFPLYRSRVSFGACFCVASEPELSKSLFLFSCKKAFACFKIINFTFSQVQKYKSTAPQVYIFHRQSCHFICCLSFSISVRCSRACFRFLVLVSIQVVQHHQPRSKINKASL
ncbi:unnamed protein product, partial [Amoebophrya sp. A120]